MVVIQLVELQINTFLSQVTRALLDVISYASSATTSSRQNRLLLIHDDVPTSVEYVTSRCRSTFVTVLPYAEFPSNFMVSAMILLSGSTSPLVGPWKQIHQSAGSMASVNTQRSGRHDQRRARAQGTTVAVVWLAESSHRGNYRLACGVAST